LASSILVGCKKNIWVKQQQIDFTNVMHRGEACKVVLPHVSLLLMAYKFRCSLLDDVTQKSKACHCFLPFADLVSFPNLSCNIL